MDLTAENSSGAADGAIGGASGAEVRLRRVAQPEIIADDLLSNPRYRVYTFHSDALGGDRPVLVYLPPGYDENPAIRYPVMFLHDGQNVFDGRTSYVANCTWQAHTTADRLTEAGVLEPLILVAVANAGIGRMAEYTPTPDVRLGGGLGPAYGRMLVEELKPAVDALFRTLPGAENTGVGGSSLGGLISLALGFWYPGVFGKLAVMSPSIWWNRGSILRLVARTEPRPEVKIWMDMGTAEGVRHLHDADVLASLLEDRGWTEGVNLRYERVDGAVHDEGAWARRLGDVLTFLFPLRPATADGVAETAAFPHT